MRAIMGRTQIRARLPAEKGEWSMKRFHMSLALLAMLMAGLASVLAPRAAAQTGSISGSIMDVNGKPWAEVVIRTLSDQGAKQETKTDIFFFQAEDGIRDVAVTGVQTCALPI